MDEFIRKVLGAAKEAGIEAAEVYYASGDSFRVMTQNGEVNNYTVNSSRGLSLRGLKDGKMGYAYTQAFDDAAVEMLVRGVLESAALTEDDSVQEIYKGDDTYPEISNYNEALDKVGEKEKIALALETEKQVRAADARIAAVPRNMFSTSSASVRIVNSYGLDLSTRDNYAFAYVSALAKEGEKVANAGKMVISRDFDAFKAEELAGEAAADALFMLNAQPVRSGVWRVIFDRYAMSDLMGVFSAIFSAENAQQGISLLKGKEGTRVASEQVTVMDDPLLPGGLDSRSFDDEGVASRTKCVVEKGILKTLLYDLKTAKKAGCASTGNARRSSYSAPVHVSPTNFFLRPGDAAQEELMARMGSGLVITDVSGLHAGANLASGDFSLLAEGYTVKDGKKDAPVDRITVAGNFYRLLENIRAVGNDLIFPGSGVGSPSVDVGELNIAGK